MKVFSGDGRIYKGTYVLPSVPSPVVFLGHVQKSDSVVLVRRLSVGVQTRKQDFLLRHTVVDNK